ncbi:MAG: hypothetical protein V1731_02785 [Candidatus Aenigmatarchaeota archaeon]
MYRGSRTFNTAEEAIATWQKEAEARMMRSGILCRCHCYAPGVGGYDPDVGSVRGVSPLRWCLKLLPEDTYRKYERDTREEDKYYYSKKQVAVTHPGEIRVRLDAREENNYSVKHDICPSPSAESLLLGYLGKKVRLGKNIIVKE